MKKKIGRKRINKNDPRTLDIDIIDFDHKFVIYGSKNKLILPHPNMTTRNFVLLPLFEISRSWTHPKSKISITNLINLLAINDLRTIKLI